jgi:hypothetical protein
MNKIIAINFIESFKVSINKKSINQILKINALFSILTFLMFYVNENYSGAVLIFSILSVNVILLIILTRHSLFLYPTFYIAAIINDLFTITVINIFYVSFNMYFDTPHDVPFIVFILMQVVFAFVIVCYRLNSFKKGKFKTYDSASKLTFSSFLSFYIIIRFMNNPKFTSVHLLIANLGVLLIAFVFIYYIFAQLLTRYSLIVKYKIPDSN